MDLLMRLLIEPFGRLRTLLAGLGLASLAITALAAPFQVECDHAGPTMPAKLLTERSFNGSTVVACWNIVPTGWTADIVVVQSSGYPDLDQAVEDIITGLSCRVTPALDSKLRVMQTYTFTTQAQRATVDGPTVGCPRSP